MGGYQANLWFSTPTPLVFVFVFVFFKGVSWPGTKRGKRVNGCSTLFDPSGVEFLRPRGCNVAHALAKSPGKTNYLTKHFGTSVRPCSKSDLGYPVVGD